MKCRECVFLLCYERRCRLQIKGWALMAKELELGDYLRNVPQVNLHEDCHCPEKLQSALIEQAILAGVTPEMLEKARAAKTELEVKSDAD